MVKRYQTSWSGQRHVIKRANWWMQQPLWARSMVYILVGFIIGHLWG